MIYNQEEQFDKEMAETKKIEKQEMKKDMKGIKWKCWEMGLHRRQLKYAKLDSQYVKIRDDLFCFVLKQNISALKSH